MYSLNTRLILAITATLLAIYCFRNELPVSGFMAMLAISLLIIAYIRYGSVYRAFKATKSGHQQQAKRFIHETFKAEWLNKTHLAYFYWVKARVAAADGDNELAVYYFQQAFEGKLRTENDKVLVACALAGLVLIKGEYDKALEYLNSVSSLEMKIPVQIQFNKLKLLVEIQRRGIKIH